MLNHEIQPPLPDPSTSCSQTSSGKKPVEVRSQSPVSQDYRATISSARDEETIQLQHIIPDEDPE